MDDELLVMLEPLEDGGARLTVEGPRETVVAVFASIVGGVEDDEEGMDVGPS